MSTMKRRDEVIVGNRGKGRLSRACAAMQCRVARVPGRRVRADVSVARQEETTCVWNVRGERNRSG